MTDRAKYEAWLKRVVDKAHHFPHRGTDVLGLVLESSHLVRSGTWVEFGVASGSTLKRIASRRGQARVWGFDTFTGLPEDWRTEGAVHLKGHFAQDHIPKVPDAHLVTGLFQDTLPSWHPPDVINFVHIDCDIYSATKCAFDHVIPRLGPGAIISFDELLDYPTFEDHEIKALYEAEEAGLEWEFLYVSGERAAIICGPHNLKLDDPSEIEYIAYTPDPGYTPPEVLPPVKAPSVQKSSKKLAFLLDPWACPRPIDPEIVFTASRGLTGSEVTCLTQAIEMAKRGHDVTFYSNVKRDCRVHGIEFARWDRWPNEAKSENWYASFATIHPGGFRHLPPGTLRVFNQQVNDFGYCQGWEQYTDVVTSLSHAHQKHLSQFTSFQNWQTLPNGCDPSAYHDGPRKNGKLVWASSPDRGLHWLLELFPRLKKRVPDAECHIYYDFQDDAESVLDRIGEKELANRYRYIKLALPKLVNHGVFHHKSVSRREIADVLSESRVLAYTCDPVRFTEGFSCTTLEAAVAGCVPVICGADALSEIYGDFVPVTPAPYSANREAYFESLLKYMTDNAAYQSAQARCRELAKTHDWKVISGQLEKIFRLV